jgi:hypothetical protein
MRLEVVENSLPNGFHDAEIESLEIDYEKRTAKIMFGIWVGDLCSKEKSIREAYQNVKLLINELVYFVIESPALLTHIQKLHL